jgi:hypothetical protein
MRSKRCRWEKLHAIYSGQSNLAAMKIHLIVLFFLCVSIQVSNAQRFDKKAFDKKYELKNDVAYVINGVLYQPRERARIDSALGAYPIEHLVEVSKVSGMNGYKNNEIVIISFAYKQSARQIFKALEAIKDKFSDRYAGSELSASAYLKNPVLWIDNENIPQAKARQAIEKLKPDDIYFIDYKKDQINAARYGQNAKNGLVRVWTSKSGSKELINE